MSYQSVTVFLWLLLLEVQKQWARLVDTWGNKSWYTEQMTFQVAILKVLSRLK